MQFSDIIGLAEVKHTLLKAYERNHVAHAQLFLGKDGGGQLAMALAYATFLNCENKQIADSCGQCNACQKYNKLIHPDLHFVFPTFTNKDKAGSEAYLKEWRSFLGESSYSSFYDWTKFIEADNKQCLIPVQEGRNIIQNLTLKAYEGQYKTLIIWLPELMNVNAANAILKILEEPPEKTIFLMVSNSVDRMLATILSRTQMLNVRPFTDEEVRNYLEKKGLIAEQAAQVALLAEGNLGEALRLSQDAQDDKQVIFRDWMRDCYRADLALLVKWAEKFGTLTKENQKAFLQYGLTMVRESFLYRYVGEKGVHLENEGLHFVQKFHIFIHERNIDRFVLAFNEAYRHIERNANAKIMFLDLSLKSMAWLREK